MIAVQLRFLILVGVVVRDECDNVCAGNCDYDDGYGFGCCYACMVTVAVVVIYSL